MPVAWRLSAPAADIAADTTAAADTAAAVADTADVTDALLLNKRKSLHPVQLKHCRLLQN